MSIKAVAVLIGELVRGIVHFEQEGYDTPVHVYGVIRNLSPGNHGLQVHQFGDTREGCKSTGNVFNPTNVTQGETARLVGDLGNLVVDETGISKFEFIDHAIQLKGPNSIIGRSIVVLDSKDATGKVAGRLACGVIGITVI